MSQFAALAHLTLPGAVAPGPLPLPPEGRRGALLSKAAALSVEEGGGVATDINSPGSPPASGGRG
jgi:hypothetical protein